MATTKKISRVRIIAFYALAGLMTAMTLLEMINHLIDDSVSPHHIHSAGHAIFSIAILAALGTQLWHPARHVVGLQTLFVIMVVAAMADAASLRFGGLEVILLAFFAVLAPLHPARGKLLTITVPRWQVLALAAVGSVPLLVFSLAQAAMQRVGFEAAHADPGHWSWMAGAAILVAATAIFSAVAVRGWRIPTYTAAACLAILGAASLAFAGEPSAFPVAWAFAAIVGSVAFVGVSEIDRTRAGSASVAPVLG